MTVYRRSSLYQEKERLERANQHLRREVEDLSGLYGREVVENSLLREDLAGAKKIIAFWKRTVSAGALGFGYSVACATLLSFACAAGITLEESGQGGINSCDLPAYDRDADSNDTDWPATPRRLIDCAILTPSQRVAIESNLEMRLNCAQVTLIWPARNVL